MPASQTLKNWEALDNIGASISGIGLWDALRHYGKQVFSGPLTIQKTFSPACHVQEGNPR